MLTKKTVAYAADFAAKDLSRHPYGLQENFWELKKTRAVDDKEMVRHRQDVGK